MKTTVKLFALAFAVALLPSTLSIAAKPKCKKQPVTELAKALVESYENKSMASLDATQPYVGRFRILIEHSLDDTNQFESRYFRSLAQAESWLKRREHEGMPTRSIRPLVKCARGVCSYNFDGGILHNNLYLKRITYGIRNGCPYIKTIHLLDGD